MIDAGAALMFFFFGGIFTVLFLLQRHAYRIRKRKRLEPGFYPATRDLGNSLHSLQIFARPAITHVMQVKLATPREEDNNGDDD